MNRLFVRLLTLVLFLGPASQARNIWGAQPAQRPALDRASGEHVSVVLEGFVNHPDGRPAAGATVTTSHGGTTVAEASGSFRVELRLEPGTHEVEIRAAAADEPGADLSASVEVPLSLSSSQPSWTWVGLLLLEPYELF